MRPWYSLLSVWCLLLAAPITAQTTVVLVLDSADEDAYVDDYAPDANYPDKAEFLGGAWTIGGQAVTWRTFMQFDLTPVPAGATIMDARLSLYFPPSNEFGDDASTGNSNASVLQRITSPWSEHSVTWNTQPTTTSVDQVTLLESSSGTQDYPNIDVTALVQDIVNDLSNSYGFSLRLASELAYARLMFASGDHPTALLHPKLQITFSYPVPCTNLTLNAPDEDATVDSYAPDTNYPDGIDYCSGAWSIGGNTVAWRSLFKFDLSSLPSTMIVDQAYLSLYFARNNSFADTHQSFTGSDAGVLQRIVDPWAESTVTWNTQPAATASNEVDLAQSVAPTQDYTNVNVTALVQDMVSDPANSHGFLLKGVDETPYHRLLFGSSDNPDPNWHPTLDICYYDPNGIFEGSPDPGLNMFPDPASDMVTVEMGRGVFQQMILFDVMGRTVISVPIPRSSEKVMLDVSGMRAGAYAFTFTGDGGVRQGRLIVE